MAPYLSAGAKTKVRCVQPKEGVMAGSSRCFPAAIKLALGMERATTATPQAPA